MAQLLIIDDEPMIRMMLADRLTQVGHRVSEAADGAKGLKAFAQQPADLVLCDLYMPEKEGLETIQELRRLYPAVRIIAMSGGDRKSSEDFLPLATALGADSAIHKPFDLDRLVDLIDSLLLSGA
jgi:DNA-binding response OmpR family regulator